MTTRIFLMFVALLVSGCIRPSDPPLACGFTLTPSTTKLAQNESVTLSMAYRNCTDEPVVFDEWRCSDSDVWPLRLEGPSGSLTLRRDGAAADLSDSLCHKQGWPPRVIEPGTTLYDNRTWNGHYTGGECPLGQTCPAAPGVYHAIAQAGTAGAHQAEVSIKLRDS